MNTSLAAFAAKATRCAVCAVTVEGRAAFISNGTLVNVCKTKNKYKTTLMRSVTHWIASVTPSMSRAKMPHAGKTRPKHSQDKGYRLKIVSSVS